MQGVHAVIWGRFKRSQPSSKPLPPSAWLDAGQSDTLPPAHGMRAMPIIQDSAWSAACDSYSQWLKLNSMPRSAAFLNFGTVHLAVAEILWEQRDELQAQGGQRVAHLSSSAGLVAVYSIAQRSVQVRQHNTALAQVARTQGLSLRMLPGTAGLLEGEVAQDFQTHSLASLMWHYAQFAPQAMQQMPRLQEQMLSIRRFPTLSPDSLQLRHLRLIHRLSRDNIRFEALQARLYPDDAALICPDLAALYFTGVLRLKSP
jgi:hypothetical protein